MDKLTQFNKMFKVPPAMRPYVAQVVAPHEIDLILAMDGETLGAEAIRQRMGWSKEETADRLGRAYERHIITKVISDQSVGYIFDYVDPEGKEVLWAPAKFYDRLEPLTMQENWSDIPETVRKEISEWWLQGYVDKVAPVVAQIKEDPDAYFQIKQKDFLLLEEALEQVEAARFHVVVNCDCRSSEMACGHMKEGCIRFDDGARYSINRGLGRVVSKEECRRIVIETDRDGLMHIGGKSWQEHGLFGFCNCCTCCCFPLRTSVRLQSEKKYPRVHFCADRDPAKCTHCGICTKRCPFEAFHRDGSTVEIKGKKRKAVAFDQEKCFGCGLCATACPEEAIQMVPVKGL